MANTIDINAIDGYQEMTADQLRAFIESFEYNDNSIELEKFKNAVSKANAEAKQWKDKYNAKSEEAKALMSEEQQKQAALAEAAEVDKAEREELLARIAELEKNNTLREYTMSFNALGMDEKLSSETAAALVDGDSVKMFANLKEFLKVHDKAFEADLISRTPKPDGGLRITPANKNAGIDIAKQLAGARTAGPGKNYQDIIGMYTKSGARR